MTALSSQEGAFETSTTTDAPVSTRASPWPVSVLTPEVGDAATASWPCSRSLGTTFDPMRPLPPMTTIFTIVSLVFRLRYCELAARTRYDRAPHRFVTISL